MTVYIAGPMTGLPNDNIERFFAIERDLTVAGLKVLNPAKIGKLPEYEMYWPINKVMLDGANIICLLDGWEKSEGAKREFAYALENGIFPVLESSDWMDVLCNLTKG